MPQSVYELLSLPPIHLPPVMALYAPNSLSEAVSTPMLVVGLAIFVLVEDDTRRIPRNAGAMQVPVMPRVPALDGHIVLIHRDNVEISLIYRL